jgi:putative spermidine/putrescine transport system permease protein
MAGAPSSMILAEWARRSGLWAIALAVLGFLILPILIIVPLSFSSGTFLTFPLPGLSLRWYQEFFTSAPWRL